MKDASENPGDRQVKFGVFVEDRRSGVRTAIDIPKRVMESQGIDEAFEQAAAIAMELNTRSVAEYDDAVKEAFAVFAVGDDE